MCPKSQYLIYKNNFFGWHLSHFVKNNIQILFLAKRSFCIVISKSKIFALKNLNNNNKLLLANPTP